jgi:WD40 repeat protein
MDIPENWESENTWIAMAFSPDGKTLVTGDIKGSLVEWDTEIGIEKRRVTLPCGYLVQLFFLPSADRVIASNLGASIGLYSLETGQSLYILRGMFASLSRDGTRLLFNGDGSICLHNAATGELIRSFPSEIVPVKQSIALSPDGNLAIMDTASGAEEAYPLKVLDMNTGEVLRTYAVGSTGLRGISPDGKYFLRAENGRLLLYDISDLQAAVKEPSMDKQE